MQHSTTITLAPALVLVEEEPVPEIRVSAAPKGRLAIVCGHCGPLGHHVAARHAESLTADHLAAHRAGEAAA